MLHAAFVRVLCAAAFLAFALLGSLAIAADYFGYPPRAHPYPHQLVRQFPGNGLGTYDTLASLGQKLFFDTRLSGTGTKACASCHNPGYGYAEPRWVSISDNGRLGRRNAPSLVDVGFLPRLMWDGRFNTLEQQALGPFQSGEMGIRIEEAVHRLNSDPEYQHLFRGALGGYATPDSFGRAVAAFQRTIVSRPSRVDRFLTSNEPALTPIERDGLGIFTGKAGCSNCHHLFPILPNGRPPSRPLFTDFQFHNLGVGYRGGFGDTGRFEQSRNPAEWGVFRTPSLRNSARTPPYMHDGSFATLEEVVDFYRAGGRPNPNISPLIRPLPVSDYDKRALVAFLRAMGE